MPSPNLEKIYLEQSFYHIYNRGVNKQPVFIDAKDYSVFLNLLKRYLDSEPAKDKSGREYDWLHKKLELVAFCLMPTHFHLFIFQYTPEAMTRLLRGVSTSYTGYFNKRHKRTGPLFTDRFRASMINNDAYLIHISRYIHLNPGKYRSHEWSSLPYYLGKKRADWVRPRRILELFDDKKDYSDFLKDYEEHKKMLDDLKSQLADG